MTVHVVPIEPLDQRYTAQWGRWFKDEFRRLEVDAQYVEPGAGESYQRIRSGQFLDVIRTNLYKSEQLRLICDKLVIGNIADGDIIFFHDLWYPGLEMLFYIRDALKLNIKIVGVVHAGTYDPHDYLTQCGMERWAAGLERAWLNEVDRIYVSCPFHEDLLRSTRMYAEANNIAVTGLPLMTAEYDDALGKAKRDSAVRENRIVFPHRLAPEKQPELFDKLATFMTAEFPGWSFVKTQSTPRTKHEYCRLLATSKVAVSFALQETWGIGMQEAAYLGCIPIVPRRLAYVDLYPEELMHDDFVNPNNLYQKVCWAAENYDEIVAASWYRHWLQKLRSHNNNAIGRMVADFSKQGWL